MAASHPAIRSIRASVQPRKAMDALNAHATITNVAISAGLSGETCSKGASATIQGKASNAVGISTIMMTIP